MTDDKVERAAPIKSGDLVRVQTADGTWLPAVAASGVEATHRHGKRIHDFPVIPVFIGCDGPMPWPAESVERRRP